MEMEDRDYIVGIFTILQNIRYCGSYHIITEMISLFSTQSLDWVGSLLFLIYKNDLCHVCDESVTIWFADDTNLFSQDLRQLMSSMKNFRMVKVNKMHLNINKIHYEFFARYKRQDNSVNLGLDNMHTYMGEFQQSKLLI